MKKFYLILLIFFFICYNNYTQISDKKLSDIKLTSELKFESISLENALKILTKESKVKLLAKNDIKNTELNIMFAINDTVEDVVNTILNLYNFTAISTEEGYLIAKSGKINFEKDEENHENGINFTGKIESYEFFNGVDGVKITLTNSLYPPQYSKNGGFFSFKNIENGVYIVKFEKNGYITKGEIINISEKNSTFKFYLEKDNKIYNNFSKNEISYFSENNEIVTKQINIFNSNIVELKNLLKDTLGEELRVGILQKQNIIVLSGNKKVVENASALVKSIDKNTKQIRVSSQILDISNNLFETLGFNWIYNNTTSATGKNNTDVNVSLLSNSNIAGIGNVFSSGVQVFNQFNNGNDILNLGINLLESNQDLVVSAKPSILIIDGEEGVFKVTEEVIVGEKITNNEKTDKSTSTPLFKEAGIILKVTPYIKEEDYVILKILIEVSNFKLKIDKESGNETYNSEGGSKVGRSIETTIKIKNGETIFIGGLKKATVYNLNSKVPFFGTLPMINFFFKNQKISHEITDIYIKLKVDIVENENDSFEKNEIHQRSQEIKNKKIY